MSITRTQVRFPEPVHAKLKQYVEKHGCSMNEAIVRLVSDGVLEDSLATPENKDVYIDVIDEHLPHLSVESVKKVCKLTVHLSNMEDAM